MDNPKSIWKLALHFRANFSRTWENNYNTLKSTQLANGNSALSLSQTNGMNGIFFRLLSLVKAYLGTSAVVKFVLYWAAAQWQIPRRRGRRPADSCWREKSYQPSASLISDLLPIFIVRFFKFSPFSGVWRISVWQE